MAFNVPTYDTTRITFGPGQLFLGAQGTTPLIDIGTVKGDVSLKIKRTLITVTMGSPRTPIIKFASMEDVDFKINGLEWNMNMLAYALGAGVTSLSGAQEALALGGDMNMAGYALMFQHRMADGSTLLLEIFKAVGSGEIDAAIKEADTHEITYNFSVLEGTTDFQGSALANKQKHFKIVRIKA